MNQMFRCLITIITGALLAQTVSAREAKIVNLSSDQAPALAAAAKELGFGLKVARSDDSAIGGDVLVWEARAGGGREISPEAAASIGEWVRNGGSLFLTLSDDPGTGPMRLAFVLPTTAWQTQAQAKAGAHATGGTSTLDADPEVFPHPGDADLNLSFFYAIRPFSAVERGEGRYERFDRTVPYIEMPVRSGNTFWTRPLLNRDWRVRLHAGDLGHTPVLITGRYGAGRVAVFGSSIASIGPDSKPFWEDVLRWLTAGETPEKATVLPKSASLPAPTCEVDAPHRLLRVTVRNPGPVSIHVKVLARLLTWERAIVGDVEKDIAVPQHGEAVADLPLPKSDALSYQALAFRDAFYVRLGLLSSDGSTLFNESQVPVDLRRPLLLGVATDNLRAPDYPFKAPGPETLPFPTRLGMEVNSYAYLPGQAAHVTVTVANGIRNIAPLADAKDGTTPSNPSVMALNDESAHAEQGGNPDKIGGYGSWTGQAGRENDLSFTFPAPVTVNGVTLVGSPDNYRFYLLHNPGAAIIELDGREVARAENLDLRFISDLGNVRLEFAPQQARIVRIRLPWVAKPISLPKGTRQREAPWLGEVRIDGAVGPLPAPQHGKMSLALVDAMSGEKSPIMQREVNLTSGALQKITVAVPIPQSAATGFYRIEASFAGEEAVAPLLAIQPLHPLEPLRDLKPSTAPDMGFIVTRGFRNVFDTGTGTAELSDSWGTPDDLVWAYSHQMKQIGKNSRTKADRLYVSESDMRHYSTPWRSFPNGEFFYDIAPELLVARMKQDRRWADSPVVLLSHSDRWDPAPDVDALYGWQDFIGFDDELRQAGLPGLQGRTRKEIAAEIHDKYEHRWQAWQLARYVHAVRNLREAFAKEGKQLVITAQGSPLVSADAEAELAQTIRGQSDDGTWGMIEESVPLTTGRQMGVMAFNPGWAMSTLFQWGYDSAVLNNPHWHNPVGTTEPSRRHLYDRAWRGIIGRDGVYRSMHTYGYNTNAGDSYTMTENDWQQSWQVQERHSLIAPDGPFGVGIVISTARFSDPAHSSFSGSGGSGAGEADEQVRIVERVVRRLEEAGISISFSANAAVLNKWTGSAPLILIGVNQFSADEKEAVRSLGARGVKIAAFTSEQLPELSASIESEFGVHSDRSGGIATNVGQVEEVPIYATNQTLFANVPIDGLTADQAQALAPLLKQYLNIPIDFPTGTAGYGFTSQGLKYIVLEDWMEQGRTVSLKIRGNPGQARVRAVNVNDHRPLDVYSDSGDWVIKVPIRPGDGTLIAIEEGK